MQFIDAYTSREDLLSAIYREGLLLDSLIDEGVDPEEMTTDEIRARVIAWIEAGDECDAP